MGIPSRKPAERALAWLAVTACLMAIYLAIPIARIVQKAVTDHIGRSFFGFLVIASIGAGFAAVIFLLIFRLKVRSPANYAWLIAVAAVYVVVTVQRWKVPEEAVHFLEYGVLGILVFYALSRSIKDGTVYADAMIIGSLAGLTDEIIQWIVPGRVWDFRDAGFNILSSLLIQIAIWKGIRPKGIRQPVTAVSIRRLSVLLGIFLVIFGLCLSNTPKRVRWIANKIPVLSFLEKEEPMRERTFRYNDPEIGVFHSRLPIGELTRTDAERGKEFGGTLRDWKARSYEEFLRMFSTIHNPFLHEIRVHIFRRDTMNYRAGNIARETAGLSSGGAEAKRSLKRKNRDRKAALFAAAKENLILEKYYPRTLEYSGYRWPPQKKAAVEKDIDISAPYESPVASPGGGWLASLSETASWGFIAACLIGMTVFNIIFGARYRKRHAHEERIPSFMSR